MSEQSSGIAAAPGRPDAAPPRSLSWRAWSLLPTPVRKWVRACIMSRRLRRNFRYDMARFKGATRLLYKDYGRENLRALITMDYHRIEKGLSLPEPRPRFGADVLERLQRDLPVYLKQHGPDETTDVAFNALREYVEFHAGLGIDFPEIRAFLADKCVPGAAKPEGGTHPLTAEEVRGATDFDVDRFFFARHSIRQFKDEPVSSDLLGRAVRLAMESPSVCNRQSWRVHAFTERARIDELLAFQDGNRGFGHTAPLLLIVTSDMRIFNKPGERNQCWVDGGMFSMALVLSLHALGLGSCCLNWSVESGRDASMRAKAGIPDNESVMMMMAVGHIPETLRVAQSPRRPLETVLIRDGQGS